MAKNKAISIAVSLLLILTLALSVAYVVREVHHDCTGEHCPVCHQIRICEQMWNGAVALGRSGASLVALILIDFIFRCLRSSDTRVQTPVTLKVKLSI